MASTRRLAGITHINVDGNAYDLVGEVLWSPSTIVRETLVGLDRVHGFSEKPYAGFIEAQLRDNSGLHVLDFNSMTDTTVQIEQANGKKIILTGGWTVDHQEVNPENGTFKVKFESDSVTEG